MIKLSHFTDSVLGFPKYGKMRVLTRFKGWRIRSRLVLRRSDRCDRKED